MNNEEIPNDYFIDNKKGIVRFIPEKNVVKEKYNAVRWKKLFSTFKDLTGSDKNIDFSKLQLSNITRYSVANPSIGHGLEHLLKKYIGMFLNKPIEELVVTETNGGVGGLSIRLANIFNKINIVEINDIHVRMLENNLKVYGYESPKTNIQIYNEDYMDIAYDLNQDIIVSDPPWGGYDYSKSKSMKLGFNNVNIAYVINQLYSKNKFKFYILLAMYNFDIQNFINRLVPKDIIIYNMGKHYFILVLGKL